MGYALRIVVYGEPAPQGSKKIVGSNRMGRGIMVESSAKVKPWREAVKYAALMARGIGPDPDVPIVPTIIGPVLLHVVFTLRRPKSAKRGAVPDKKPDLDKLIRSTCDALTDAGVWEDDSRVISMAVDKTYPGAGPALDSPGAIIFVSSALFQFPKAQS